MTSLEKRIAKQKELIRVRDEARFLNRAPRFWDLVLRSFPQLFGIAMPCEVVDLQDLEDSLTDDFTPLNRAVPVKNPFDTFAFFEWRQDGHRIGVLAYDWTNSKREESVDMSFHVYILPNYVGNVGIEFVGTVEIELNSNDLVTEIGRVGANKNTKFFRDMTRTGIVKSEEIEDLIWTQAMTAVFAYQLISCRNIVLVDHHPAPADNSEFIQRYGSELTSYKTLSIKPIGKRTDTDPPQRQFDVMPLHLRRGNFAHYTVDAPLFGKYVGTFWRPATVVGNEKNGIVDKDYEVKP